MAIKLPARSLGADPGRRGGRLPDAGDVPTMAQPRDPGVAFGRLSDAGMLGKGIEAAGDAIGAIAAKQQKLQDATGITEGKIAFDDVGMTEFRRRQTEDDPSRPDFMKDYGTFLDEKQKEILEGASGNLSKGAQEALRLRLLESREAMVDSAGRLQLAAGEQKAADLWQARINTYSAQASRDPQFLDTFLKMSDEELADYRGGISADKERDFRTKARQNIIVSALGGLVEKKQFDKAQEILKSGQFDDDLLPAQRTKVMTAIETGRKEETASLKADVRLELGDEVASIRETGAGIGLSKDRIRAAFPDKADRILKTLGEERAFFQAKSTIALNSPEEDRALLTSLQPSGEGFKVEAERRDAAMKAVQAKYTALAKDPAGYALAASKELQNAFTAADSDPKAMPKALALLDETQARLGVPEHLRRVLSDADAKAQTQALTQTSAEASADRIQALADRYGDHWPTAYRDMVRAGLPTSYRVLATVDNPIVRKSLAEALRTEAEKKGTLRAGAGEDAKEIDDNVNQALAEFRASLTYAPDGAMIAGDVEKAAKLLGYRYHNTMSASEAAQRAVNDLVGKYTFIQDDSHNARAPKDMARQAEDMSERIVRGLTADQMPDIGGNQDISPERRKEIMLSAAKRGTWITNETDDGWLLLDINQQPVMRADGTRIEFKFTDEPLPEGPRPVLDPTSPRARQRATVKGITGAPSERGVRIE